jgi:two-component system LytT family response regulator
MQTLTPAPDTILLPAAKGRVHVPFTEIVRLEGCRNYTAFILANGQKLLASKTISYYDDILPDTFLKVHKRCVVNVKFISQRKERKLEKIHLKDGFSIEISRRKKPFVRAIIQRELSNLY